MRSFWTTFLATFTVKTPDLPDPKSRSFPDLPGFSIRNPLRKTRSIEKSLVRDSPDGRVVEVSIKVVLGIFWPSVP